MDGEESEGQGDIRDAHSHVIECERCGGRFGTDSQFALDKVRDVLEGSEQCEDPRGHKIVQIEP